MAKSLREATDEELAADAQMGMAGQGPIVEAMRRLEKAPKGSEKAPKAIRVSFCCYVNLGRAHWPLSSRSRPRHIALDIGLGELKGGILEAAQSPTTHGTTTTHKGRLVHDNADQQEPEAIDEKGRVSDGRE